MRLFAVLVVAIMAVTPAFAGIVNGDWQTGDETGWTRVEGGWGSNMNFNVAAVGPTPPAGQLNFGTGGEGSYGWVQVITDLPLVECTVDTDWVGNNIGWAEVMFWTVPAETGMATITGTFDAGPTSAIAYKRDAYGMYTNSWDWQKASLSPHPSGNGGTIVNEGWVVVGLKLGRSGVGTADAAWDNITVTPVPEPSSMLALGTGLFGLAGFAIRRRR